MNTKQVIALVIVIVLAVVFYVWYKNKPITDGNVYGSENEIGDIIPYEDSGVIFYEHINYGGKTTLPIPKGSYTLRQLESYGFVNDSVSSFKIPYGWLMEIYKDDYGKGVIGAYTQDTPYIGDKYNDSVSSIKIT